MSLLFHLSLEIPVLSFLLFSALLLSCLSSSVLLFSLSHSLSLSVSVWCCARVVVLCCGVSCCVVLCLVLWCVCEVVCGVVCVVWHRENPRVLKNVPVCTGTTRHMLKTHVPRDAAHTRRRFERTLRAQVGGEGRGGGGHRQFCLTNFPTWGYHGTRSSHKSNHWILPTFKFEKWSRTTRARFLPSFALPHKSCSTPALLRDTAEGISHRMVRFVFRHQHPSVTNDLHVRHFP